MLPGLQLVDKFESAGMSGRKASCAILTPSTFSPHPASMRPTSTSCPPDPRRTTALRRRCQPTRTTCGWCRTFRTDSRSRPLPRSPRRSRAAARTSRSASLARMRCMRMLHMSTERTLVLSSVSRRGQAKSGAAPYRPAGSDPSVSQTRNSRPLSPTLPLGRSLS